jgi:hypothetical protein
MLKKIIYILVLLLLLAPVLLKYVLKQANPFELRGDFVPAKKTVFLWDDWWSGAYSLSKTNWLNENFGDAIFWCAALIKFGSQYLKNQRIKNLLLVKTDISTKWLICSIIQGLGLFRNLS